MGNSASARRRTQSNATSPNDRSPIAPSKQDKLRPRSSSENVIDPSNLAPRTQIESNFPENSECPICFLNYAELNTATCCKQPICTDCYLLMKHSHDASKCPCPFCSNETLNVVYTSLTIKTTSGMYQPVTGLITEGISSYSSASTLSKTDGSDSTLSIGVTPMINVPDGPHVPLSSIDDRRDIEIAIQQQRLRYADDRPPPAPPSARSQVSSFAQRNFLGNDFNSEFNSEFGRGGVVDFEQAALRMRFGGTFGDSFQQHSSGIRRSTSRRMSDQEIISECLEGHATNGGGGIDLDRIEDMMMMEAIRQSIASSPSSAMPPSYEEAIAGYESASERRGTNIGTGTVGGGAVEVEIREEMVFSSKTSSSPTASAHSQSTSTMKSSSAESDRSPPRYSTILSYRPAGMQTGLANSHPVHNGHLSDSERDAGVNTAAREERNEEVLLRGGPRDSPNGKVGTLSIGVGSLSPRSELSTPSKNSLIPKDYRVTRRCRPSSAVPRPLGGRFSETNIQFSPREDDIDGRGNMSERESLRGLGSPGCYLSGVHSLSLARVPSECEENKSDDDSVENTRFENNAGDRPRGMATATMINGNSHSEDLEDSLYGEIESVNSFESERGGPNHYIDNAESANGTTIGRAVRIHRTANTAGQHGGINGGEEKDNEEEEEVIILSLVLNSNDSCVVNPSDSSYYDSKKFDSAPDREDALIYM